MLDRYHILLLALGPLTGRAVRVQTGASSRSPPAGGVAGTRMLDRAEMDGRRPLFIDAFYDRAEPVAHVILNMKSFLEPTEGAVQEWGPSTRWACRWTDSGARSSRGTRTSQGTRRWTRSGHTNVDALAPARPGNASVEASFNDNTFHWTIVISCPTVPALVNSSSATLDLIGERSGQVAYSRVGIPVSGSRFVKAGVDFALCTMVDRGKHSGADYLQPWVQYHLALGFTQVLIYVEEEDTAWAEEALRNDTDNGQVTIVPFYFGKVSARKEFILQGAMESHCLYQARGMAKWIAHMDIDEYLDFLRPDVNMRNYPFPTPDSKDVAVRVKNKFFGIIPESPRVISRFPCNINAKSITTNELGKRSKNIIRPEYVDALFPHFVVKMPGYTEVHPDASSELRLNHFKGCDTIGDGCWATAQRHNERRKLVDDGNDWKDRCEALLASGA